MGDRRKFFRNIFDETKIEDKNKAKTLPPLEVLKESDKMNRNKLAKMEEAKKQELPEVLTKAELTKLAGMLMEA